MSVARVNLWGRTIGAVNWDSDRRLAYFEYTPEFARSAIEVAPLTMPLAQHIYSFPALSRETFHGLPGLLADSIPDRFGSALIDAWLAKQGRAAESFDPVERLCYVGTRGMGALEFEPATGPPGTRSTPIDVDALVSLAGDILSKRENLEASFADPAREEALRDILRVGTSAGGARAKAIIAWNPDTNEVRSGQVQADPGFSHWLLKFDGVTGNKDKELEDPAGYGLVEYAYYLMALDAGIDMMDSHLLCENDRNHFMTRRFDRTDSGHKLHMLSLGAIAHFDFNQSGAYSYEQALNTMRQLDLPMQSIEQQFTRMSFNIVARNQDDHVKNIAFLMNKQGRWSLSPAFDVTYSYNPSGLWTNTHQMSMNGKRDGFVRDDFLDCAKNASMKRGRAAEIVERVQGAVRNWTHYAASAGVPPETATRIAKTHRLSMAKA